ncbi:tripeptidyl-peptidase 2 [Canna indica]|uniref:Tripeptidyl-peptidase 2 n=1 Tax=Canna indica TaxID=4628 RepID=A0AAQ3QES9_9LILI|nr:tripeptidyl-peptidase 2 [Canna indica]
MSVKFMFEVVMDCRHLGGCCLCFLILAYGRVVTGLITLGRGVDTHRRTYSSAINPVNLGNNPFIYKNNICIICEEPNRYSTNPTFRLREVADAGGPLQHIISPCPHLTANYRCLFHHFLRSRSPRSPARILAEERAMPPPSSSSPSSASLLPSPGENNSEKSGARESSFKFTESTFLASLMPKKEIGADRFLEAHPTYDGRGVLIAIFDSGVDPAAAGLQVTSNGKPKIIDILDCTGSGDVDTSKVVKADDDGCILGASGTKLAVNPSWKNPSQEWHVGYKLVYELFTNTLTSRLKKERKKKWDEKNQEAISEALKQLNEFDKKHAKLEDLKLKKAREDLQNKLDFLRKGAESYDDKGPAFDVVVWNDGDVWRVAVDTQSFEDSPDNGKLADFVPLTNYRTEHKFGIFSKLDACSFVTNVYDDGNLVSIVTDCSPHATHVAGIATAYHPEEPLLNGVAPGAQLISCKIGDTRLGSMETGTGLTRALIAAVEHKCDLINMSYGEPTLLPDYGRFIDLVNEVVDKHRLIFVSSAGNSGPALTTVGAPGGTTSSIIGVGAYVSPAMAAGAHCVVNPPVEGLEYTWSSRGPTADGHLGVCISAPGGAVAPVPTWTLQRRMLMNGTSMASPSACGGIALLVSAMKAEGIIVSPYIVRRALENTAKSIGDVAEEKLTTGEGLVQVDKAYEYVQKCKDFPSVSYKITVNLVGKTTPTFRGIYMRGLGACQQASEWTVQVEPKFHEGASNLEELVPFEECIELHSSNDLVVQAPEYLMLTYNGRSFNIVVDPLKLSNGLHYHEVYGIDSKAPWRGPLFRVPITIIKPFAPVGNPPIFSFSNASFSPGYIKRRFIEVPIGATWVEATMRTSGFDTARKFYIDTVQICPLKRPIKWEAVVTFSSPSVKSFTFPVKGGFTMELAVSQFWSSGIGSHEPTLVDFEVVFHGINISQESLVLDGSEAPTRVVARSLLASEKLVPAATLDKIKMPFCPVDSNLRTLQTKRDKLPSGEQIIALTLIYKFKLNEGAEIKPCIPLLNNRIYDNKFESQLYTISDSNKRVYAFGDVYPDYVKVPKGEFTLRLYIRHESIHILDKLKNLVLFIERKLEKKDYIQLSFFSEPDGHIMGNGAFKSSDLVPGEAEAFYISPPLREKLPKYSLPGAVLLGSISYGTTSLTNGNGQNNQKPPVSYDISYLIPPSKVDEDKGKEATDSSKCVSERLDEELRDVKIRFLADLKRDTDEELSAWDQLAGSLKMEYPNYTPLLAKILECIVSGSTDQDKISHNQKIIDAANEVIDSIDTEELSKYLSIKSDPEDEETEKTKKKMEATRDQLAEALYQKGLALADSESYKVDETVVTSTTVSSTTTNLDAPAEEPDLFEETFKELKKWVDIKSTKYCMLLVIRERRCGRLGTALKFLNDMIDAEAELPKKKLYDLKIQLLDQIGWAHVTSYERQWMYVRFPSSLPIF